MDEPAFLARLRTIATHPAARGLADDAAVLGDLVLTHDMLVQGVHFLPDDPPGDVAWKLLAVNLSDLAAKGAEPLGVLLGFALGDEAWDLVFLDGLAEALAHFDVPLLGGDTVRGPRVLGLTAIGRASDAPSRSGARAGDTLWVTGAIGAAGLGLQVLLRRQESSSGQLEAPLPAQEHWDLAIEAYRRPRPRLAEGRALAPYVHAMMDVSDGLLIDATRMAEASRLALTIDLDAVPLAFSSLDPVIAATSGDDYELLFAMDGTLPVPATAIGRFSAGSGLTLTRDGAPITLPARLGWVHGQDACQARRGP